MERRWRIVEEAHGVALVRTDDGRGSVVSIDHRAGQVYSLLNDDQPLDGGLWFGRIGSAGIDYVTKPRTWVSARRAYRRLTGAKVLT